MTVELTLPWPPAKLSPNARAHWSVLARAKKAYREACYWTAWEQGARPINTKVDGLHLTLEFVPPSRRAYDLDNALARMKSGLDGVRDVLGVDDSRWSLTIKKAPPDVIGGFVRVAVSEVWEVRA
jgi:crossover junction endodeoxyribonuclease RusA